MLTHTVLFRLRRPFVEQDRERFLDALRAFADDAPHLLEPARVGVGLGLRGETPRSAEAVLEARFADREAFAAYIADPVHQALVREVLEPLCEGWWSVQAEA